MNPVEVYEGIVEGAVGTGRRFWVTARDALTLLCVAVAVTPAFKMKFWNIGAEGQILMGCVASAAMMIYAGNALPTGLLLVLMFVCSFIAGGIFFAAFHGTMGQITESFISSSTEAVNLCIFMLGVIGGLTAGILVALFILPVYYAIMNGKKERKVLDI